MKLLKGTGGVICLLLLVLSLPSGAQDDEGDDTSTRAAQLTLDFNRQGGVRVNFWLSEPPESWSKIRGALAADLHCSESRFQPLAANAHASLAINRWPADRREEYLRSLAEYNRRQLNANCDSILEWNGFGRTGAFDFTNVVTELKSTAAKEILINISFPATSNAEYSQENLTSARKVYSQFLHYRFPLDTSASVSPVHLFFGFSRDALYSNAAIVVAFILLPLAITLWMRRAALIAGKQDPVAAWFSYFRTINWCIQGSMLLWITSGLGARQAFQDWLGMALQPSWEATLLDIAIVLGPAFLIYFLCVTVSYPLHVNLRGTKWTKREFLMQQLAGVGVQIIPLMFFLAALENITADVTAASSFFLAATLSAVALRSLRMRVSKAYPYTLTKGELRDRVFELARKAGVKINQVIILPTGKGQIANAYATGNRVVMFTDYLLQHLNKREVEGVAAHEVAHLELGHVKKRALAFYGAILLPALLGGFFRGFFKGHLLTQVFPVGFPNPLYSALAWFWNWSQRDFILIVVGLALFYLLSRRFEFAADERGAVLTGDAEAQISGLLKLSRVNLMPIRWGKGTGTWLTHPSTIKRAERIAAAAGMPAEQLQAILVRHDAELKTGTGAINMAGTDDYYSVPEATDPENVRATASKQKSHYVRVWISALIHVVPPALVAWSVKLLHIEGSAAILTFLAGVIATPVICIIVSAHLGVAARKAQRQRLIERFQREGLNLNDGMAVGFSPGAVVRLYGLNYYNWDVGVLLFSSNRLSYVGEQIRFSIDASQIEGVCLGPGGPSWWKFPRVYVRWIQPDGRPSAFSLANLEPGSVWRLREKATELLTRVQNLRISSHAIAGPPGVRESPPLAIGDVTSRSPRELGSLKTNLGVLVYLIPIAIVLNALLRTDAIWYLCETILITRLIESIPYWRFRDRVLHFTAVSTPLVAAAKG